jgi:hypothetical protein
VPRIAARTGDEMMGMLFRYQYAGVAFSVMRRMLVRRLRAAWLAVARTLAWR